MPIYLHSYTYRDAPFEKVIEAVVKHGYGGIELNKAHFNPDNAAEEIASACDLANKAETAIACVDYSGDFANEDDAARQASIDQVKRTIDACAANKIPMINGFAGWIVNDAENWSANGSYIASADHWDHTVAAYEDIAGYGALNGVRVGIEVHMNTLHDSLSASSMLLDRVNHQNLFITLDPANMFAVDHAENDPHILAQHIDRIEYVHMKNCTKVSDTSYDFSVSLSEGEMPIDRWLLQLRREEYEGPYCIEYCGEGDPDGCAESDLTFLSECIRTLRRPSESP